MDFVAVQVTDLIVVVVVFGGEDGIETFVFIYYSVLQTMWLKVSTSTWNMSLAHRN